MKVKAYKTEEVEVDLNINSVIQALEDYIYTSIKIPHGAYIQDHKWYQTILANTSHSFEYNTVIRDATLYERNLWSQLVDLKASLRILPCSDFTNLRTQLHVGYLV